MYLPTGELVLKDLEIMKFSSRSALLPWKREHLPVSS